MRVRIRRTSGHYYDRTAPIPGAEQVDTERTVYATVSLKTAAAAPWAPTFFGRGRNHRERNHRACYDVADQVWVIDLDWSVLPKLVKKYGEIIVSQSDEYLEYPYCLEVYDDYRE